MKKITLLFIFAFVLSSCGFAPAESPKATGDAPIESLPKNVSYLADKDFDTDEPLPGFEADPAFILPGSPLCETDEAYYYIFADAATSQFYIYYYDKASGTSAKLCPRPECPHNDPTCNARISPLYLGVMSYADRLYTVVDNNDFKGGALRSQDEDGRNVAIVGSMEPSGMSSANETAFLHRGFYYDTCLAGKVSGANPTYYARVTQRLLDSFEEEYRIIDIEVDAMAEVRSFPVANDIYISVSSAGNLKLYRFDSKTREFETLFDGEFAPTVRSLWVDSESDIYFIGGVYETDTSALYKLGFGEKAPEKVRDLPYGENNARLINGKISALKRLDNGQMSFEVSELDGQLIIASAPEFDGIDMSTSYFAEAGLTDECLFMGAYIDNPTINAVFAIPLDGSEPKLLWLLPGLW